LLSSSAPDTNTEAHRTTWGTTPDAEDYHGVSYSVGEEEEDTTSLRLRMAYYCTSQLMQLGLLSVMMLVMETDHLLLDASSQKMLGGFPLLTGFSKIYFFFMVCRDFIFVTLLLFVHKKMSMAL